MCGAQGGAAWAERAAPPLTGHPGIMGGTHSLAAAGQPTCLQAPSSSSVPAPLGSREMVLPATTDTSFVEGEGHQATHTTGCPSSHVRVHLPVCTCARASMHGDLSLWQGPRKAISLNIEHQH